MHLSGPKSWSFPKPNEAVLLPKPKQTATKWGDRSRTVTVAANPTDTDSCDITFREFIRICTAPSGARKDFIQLLLKTFKQTWCDLNLRWVQWRIREKTSANEQLLKAQSNNIVLTMGATDQKLVLDYLFKSCSLVDTLVWVWAYRLPNCWHWMPDQVCSWVHDLNQSFAKC